MMRVYVVLEDYYLNEIYSPRICGIFSTQIGAEAKIENLKKDLHADARKNYGYEIEEYWLEQKGGI